MSIYFCCCMRIFVNFIVSHVYINVFLKRLIGIWITSIRSVKVKANLPVSFRGGRYNPQWREQQMGSWGYLTVHGVTMDLYGATQVGENVGKEGKAVGPTLKITSRIRNLEVLHGYKL